MFKVIFVAAFLFIGNIISIYNYNVQSIDTNKTISFINYHNKEILIVNTASGSNSVRQIAELQELYTRYKDSLVIIAFPSNSFGNEPKTNAEIKTFMQGYGVSFPIAALCEVQGNNMTGIYKWIGDKNMNGTISESVTTDFKKFLINRNGRIVGQYDSSVHPLSTIIQNAISVNY